MDFSSENGSGENVHVSPLDKRRYRALTLKKNGLKVLLVSDMESVNAAASMDVRVGHFSDPEDLPGLAHFCEHMLFLGTEKYPDEGSYRQYLGENGGESNAYTSMENTNYHFQVVAKGFREALDHFAQFFISPLFTDSATEREIKAVDSEAQKNLQDDGYRLFQLGKSFASTDHPFHKFGTGNKKTLWDDARESGINVRDALLKFHEEFYSANLMHLAIVAPESLDALENLVTELFSDVPNKQRKIPSDSYRDKSVASDPNRFVYVPPIKDLRVLNLVWHVPPFIPQYEAKPYQYIAHMLGHEGKGSLLSLLKARGWADGLSAGPGPSTDTFGTWEVSVQMTEEGESHTDTIIELVFGYLKLLTDQGVEKRLFDECQAIADMSFRFQEREEPVRLATRLAADMRNFPVEHYLTGPQLYYRFDSEAIHDMVALLRPETVSIVWISKLHEGKTDQAEKWYGTPFRTEKIPTEKVDAWRSAVPDDQLQIPGPNEFIPTDFSVLQPSKPDKGLYPVVIRHDDRFKVHFLQDTVFHRPKANVYFEITTPVTYYSPRHSVLANLFTMMLSDDLNEYAYNAEISGLYYGIRAVHTGMRLKFQGFNDGLEKLIGTILRHIGTFKLKRERFDIIKDALKREWSSFFKEQPYQHAIYSMYYCLETPRWHILDYLANIDSVTFEELDNLVPVLTKRLFVETLVHGNANEEEALQFVKLFEDNIPFQALSNAERVYRRVAQLPVGPGGSMLRATGPNEKDNNSAVVVYFQTGIVDTSDRRSAVLIELLSEVMEKSCFHQLRTVEQLGYIVSCSSTTMENMHGLRILVQSTVMDPDNVEKRVEAFLASFREKTLAELTTEEFEKYVYSLISIKREKEKRLSQVTNRFWSEILARTYVYDRREEEAQLLGTVTKEHLLEFFDKSIARDGENRRKMAIFIHGNEHPTETTATCSDPKVTMIDDPIDFKNSLTLNPISGLTRPQSKPTS